MQLEARSRLDLPPVQPPAGPRTRLRCDARRGAWLLGAALAALPFSTLSATAAPLADLLEANGFELLDPRPAPALQLPDLEGRTRDLSDGRGRWQLLTFFATWCGPCRAELPSLSELARQAPRGVELVAISVDTKQAAIAPFVARLGLTLPVVWDEKGAASRAFRASAIPVSYLVDPKGSVIAVAQGARDWSRAASLFAELASRRPETAAPATEVATAAPLVKPQANLPEVSAVARALATEVRPGESFTVEVEVHWQGGKDALLLHPPLLTLPDGVEQQRISAESTSRPPADGSASRAENVVTYRIELTASAPGTLALAPLEIAYSPRGGGEEETLAVSAPTIRVQAPAAAGLAGGKLALGGAGLLLALAAAAFAWRSRAARAGRCACLDPRLGDGEKALEEARRCRLEGDACGQFLAVAAALLPLADEQERATLCQSAERARYGGEAPRPAELEHWMRLAEKRVAALRPDPDATAKAGLRLRDAASEPQRSSGALA